MAMQQQVSPIGRDTVRVDGPQKVTGVAQYTSDFHFSGMLYAVPVGATIAKGKITKLETGAAEAMPGVVAILHRGNIGKIFRSIPGPGFSGICEERRPPFEDDVVRYYGQYIALAVAETFETARAAADAVMATYAFEEPNVEPQLAADDEPDEVMTTFGPLKRVESERGDPDAAFASAPVKVDHTYVTPFETHNPMEPHSTTAIWEGSTLTLYESSQGVVNLRGVLAQMLGLPAENVRVITKFVGSGFGSKLWPWTLCPLAAAAARQVNAPVRLVLARKMMFHAVGHRPRTQQRVRLGATKEGKLLSLQQDYIYTRSMLDAHHEGCGEGTPFAYSVPNLRVTFGRTKRNIGGGADMRGPGRVPGLYAIESAMNELAHDLKMDPVQLRILNEPKIDEGQGLPFSSRHMLECLQVGGEKFGWSKRNPAVGSMKRDGLTLGWGMAGCSWIAARFPAAAYIQLRDDGSCRVASATQDIGTGTYTNLAQLASAKTGVPLDKVEAVLGDTAFPEGPLSGGSMATPSLVNAVFGAADQAIESLKTIAVSTPGSPFVGHKPDELSFDNGALFLKNRRICEGRPVRRPAAARQPPHGYGQRPISGNVREPRAEVLDPILRLSLRRSHVATGDRPFARQPSGQRDRCRQDHQHIGWPQSDSGSSCDGSRHGSAGGYGIRSPKRRADQQQSRGLPGCGECGRTLNRRALPRSSRQGN